MNDKLSTMESNSRLITHNLSLKKGYKQTELGVLPTDWEVKAIAEIANIKGGGTPSSFNSSFWNGDINWFTPTEIGKTKYVYESRRKITKDGYTTSSANLLPIGTVLLTSRAGIGDTAIILNEACTNQGFQSLIVSNEYDNEYVYYLVNTSTFQKLLLKHASGSTFLEISPNKLKLIKIPLPPTLTEQTAIATALSDMDRLIEGLEKLIAKKRNIKQGAMQELLTPYVMVNGELLMVNGKPKMKEGWEVKTLDKVIDCLDNLRVPLNEEERLKMKGDIPYCGANGVVDYVNDYLIDDNIILIAEDGGYFDEYLTRPIAYQINGKCWVNNHAHILKAKKDFVQEFVFYSLVHKNILMHLASGTRAKLNKGELYKIKVNVPPKIKEQTRIAQILSDMDTEITELETQLSKYKMLKTGMMQELLTGKKRLI